MPTRVSRTSNMGNTARNAAWEIWAVSWPARSSEYLRTTALGTAVDGRRCCHPSRRSTAAVIPPVSRPQTRPRGATDRLHRSAADKMLPAVAQELGLDGQAIGVVHRRVVRNASPPPGQRV